MDYLDEESSHLLAAVRSMLELLNSCVINTNMVRGLVITTTRFFSLTGVAGSQLTIYCRWPLLMGWLPTLAVLRHQVSALVWSLERLLLVLEWQNCKGFRLKTGLDAYIAVLGAEFANGKTLELVQSPSTRFCG